MKVRLLHPARDLDLALPPRPHEATVVADLELEHLLAAMGGGDRLVLDVARAVVLHGLDDPEDIRYRQAVLHDCLAHPDIPRALYAIATDAVQGERHFWFGVGSQRPASVISHCVRVLELFLGELRRLRAVAEGGQDRVRSAALVTLLATLRKELDDDYLAEIAGHLVQLRFRAGTRLSARLDPRSEGTDYCLHARSRRSWRERLLGSEHGSLVVQIDERDEAGMLALGELRDRGLRRVAAAVGEATQHLVDFFTTLQAETAFYLGCLNLHDALVARGQNTCFPDPIPGHAPALATRGLYDPCLCLVWGQSAVGNDVEADRASLVCITGANGGGKSTLLRAVGIAQLMLQAGMFVAASSYRSDLRGRVFTHFRREEDEALVQGKLDEELARMSEIVDHITADSLLLCNESFASTNELEGADIAEGIVTELRRVGVKVVYVTHLYELARSFQRQDGQGGAVFLRAPDPELGGPPFVIVPGPPEPSSYGIEVYEKVFGASPRSPAWRPPAG